MESRNKFFYQIATIFSFILFVVSITSYSYFSHKFIAPVILSVLAFGSAGTRLYYDSYIARAEDVLRKITEKEKSE